MEQFTEKHADKITGVISTFDRIIFKGYLPIRTPEAMGAFLGGRGIRLKQFREFAFRTTGQLKDHAQTLCQKTGRPYHYCSKAIDKDQFAHDVAQKDGITDGLICVIAAMEHNTSFELRTSQSNPRLAFCRPTCLTLYFYFMDPFFGLIHVRLPTWLPFSLQVYVNGHEWLAKRLGKAGIDFTKVENAFVTVADCSKAQHIADQFMHQGWEKILHCFARRVNPFLRTLLRGMEYYWVIDQAEFATDIMFRSPQALGPLYKTLQRHAIVCISAQNIMTYLGRLRPGAFQGELSSYFIASTVPGTRLKHVLNGNCIKMYDKFGVVLRIETVINNPSQFRIRRKGKRRGRIVMGWFPMAKRVTGMYRFAEVSLAANSCYLDTLAAVDDPSNAFHALDRLCEPATLNHRQRRGINPLRACDNNLFAAVMRGEHALAGFRLKHVADHLDLRWSTNPTVKRRQRAQVSRKLQLLRAHGLIARISHTRRYRVTRLGNQLMAAALSLRQEHIPDIMKEAA